MKGRVAQVDLCPAEAGLVLSVGRVGLWLEIADADDVVSTLARALTIERIETESRAAIGRRPARRGSHRTVS